MKKCSMKNILLLTLCLLSGNTFATGGSLGSGLGPGSYSFGSTLSAGSFSDTWTFSLGASAYAGAGVGSAVVTFNFPFGSVTTGTQINSFNLRDMTTNSTLVNGTISNSSGIFGLLNFWRFELVRYVWA